MKSNLISRALSLFVIVTLTFLLMKALPGDPFNEEQALPEEIHKALLSHYGLDQPWHIQYGNYLISLAKWDLGPSFRYKDLTVNQIIAKGFPVSAVLGLTALAIALCTGLLAGTIAALWHRHWQDNVALLIVTLGISMPSFILATVLQYAVGLKLGWLPIARWGSLSHLILPALSLAALPAAFITRMVRSNMIEVMQQEYIKTARAKGVPEWQVIARHGLGNALLPVLSYLGPLIANILVGSFIVEKIFAIPGLGHAFVNSVMNRDYTVIMGTTCFYSLILLVALFFVDMAYRWLDPRIKV